MGLPSQLVNYENRQYTNGAPVLILQYFYSVFLSLSYIVFVHTTCALMLQDLSFFGNVTEKYYILTGIKMRSTQKSIHILKWGEKQRTMVLVLANILS